MQRRQRFESRWRRRIKTVGDEEIAESRAAFDAEAAPVGRLHGLAVSGVANTASVSRRQLVFEPTDDPGAVKVQSVGFSARQE